MGPCGLSTFLARGNPEPSGALPLLCYRLASPGLTGASSVAIGTDPTPTLQGSTAKAGRCFVPLFVFQEGRAFLVAVLLPWGLSWA